MPKTEHCLDWRMTAGEIDADYTRMAEENARLRSAIRKHQADVRYATQGAALSLADDALYKALEVGADKTATETHNA